MDRKVRLDVLWPETLSDGGKDAFVVGWHLNEHLVCVATVIPVAKYTPAALKQEVERLSKRFDRPSGNNAKIKEGSSLSVVGEIRSTPRKEQVTTDTTRSIWLEFIWHQDNRRPVLLHGWKFAQHIYISMCHVVLYDAAFSKLQRYRHFAIRKRKREDNQESNPMTPLQNSIVHMNHAYAIEQCLAKQPTKTPFLHKLQSIFAWPFILGFALCRPLFHLITWLLRARFPTRTPIVSGKQIKSFSLFLRLFERRVGMLAGIPEQCIKFNREYFSDAPFNVLENGYAEYMSDLVLLALDLLAGHIYRNIVPTAIAYFQRSSHVHFGNLKTHVTWLVDAPAGFKINVALALSLGKGIHLMVDVSQYAIDALSPYVDIILYVASAASIFGLSVQLGLLYDFVEFVTLQTYYLYLYFSKLHRVQFDLLSSLWRLFLGKKKNMLRDRVDSREYDVTQLLVGTLLFTIVFFVVATNSVFYLYFCLVRCIVLAIQTATWTAIVCSQMVPLFSIALWFQDKYQFPADVYLRPVKVPDALSIVFSNVHRNNCFVDDDFPEKHNSDVPDSPIPMAYFTLHPIALSLGALFTRGAAYGQALAKHYTVGKFVRCFLLGEYIAALPFQDTAMRLEKSPSMSTKQLWEALRACRWE
ncbi:hypothetical protein AeMF1_001727 [Aphanomyces euteiches]|nr:hypothetical protein AeMF1_001727 [Aphanomyces euteiches]KAH9186032.1 hypothetical protein AeNC1_011988 [Aphanomyces euteiches]